MSPYSPYSTAGIGGAITVGLIPVFTLVLSALFLRERVTRPIAIGIGCIILGAAIAAAGAWGGGGGMVGLAFFCAGAAAVFLGESPTATTLGGALLLSAGALIAARPRKPAPTHGASHAHPPTVPQAKEDEMHEIHMTMHTAPGAGAFSRWVGRTCAGWRRRHAIARTELTLSELSDATLRDIGLRRFEIGRRAIHERLTHLA